MTPSYNWVIRSWLTCGNQRSRLYCVILQVVWAAKGEPTLEATCMSWMNSIGSNEQVVATLEEAWGVATMTF